MCDKIDNIIKNYDVLYCLAKDNKVISEYSFVYLHFYQAKTILDNRTIIVFVNKLPKIYYIVPC